MNNNFNVCLDLVLHSEGGFVNNPLDPGGATNLGVTKNTWESWVGHSVDVSVIKALTPEDVEPLYKQKYWDAVDGDSLPLGVDYAVFDACVNSGPIRAIKLLQAALGVTQDGILGPKTLAAAESANPRTLATAVCDKRLAFLQSLSTYGTFGKGWERRIASVEADAFNMAA